MNKGADILIRARFRADCNGARESFYDVFTAAHFYGTMNRHNNREDYGGNYAGRY